MWRTVPREMANIIIIFATTENSGNIGNMFLKEENQIPFKTKSFQAPWDEWHFEKQDLPSNEGYSEKFKGREGEVYLKSCRYFLTHQDLNCSLKYSSVLKCMKE